MKVRSFTACTCLISPAQPVGRMPMIRLYRAFTLLMSSPIPKMRMEFSGLDPKNSHRTRNYRTLERKAVHGHLEKGVGVSVANPTLSVIDHTTWRFVEAESTVTILSKSLISMHCSKAYLHNDTGNWLWRKSQRDCSETYFSVVTKAGIPHTRAILQNTSSLPIQYVPTRNNVDFCRAHQSVQPDSKEAKPLPFCVHTLFSRNTSSTTRFTITSRGGNVWCGAQ